ncbi:MAG: helix-turn-helix transcriptional regulator [Raoultibacter sp.]
MGRSNGVLQKTVSLVRKQPSLWLGLGTFWCWCWVVIQGPKEVIFGLWEGVSVSPRELMLIVSLVSFIGLGVIQKYVPKVSEPSMRRTAIIVAGILYGATVFLPKAIGASFAFADIFEIVLSGFLIAFLWILWGGCLGGTGQKLTLRYGAFALLVAFLLALGAHTLDLERQAIIRTLLPLVSMAFLLYQNQPESGVAEGSSEQKSTFPRKLLVTLFIQGLSLGLLQALLRSVVLEKCTAPYCVWRFLFGFFGNLNMIDFCSLMSIVGFLLALFLLIFTNHFLKMNFLHLIYLVGFPLIAIGFVAVVYSPSFAVGSHPNLFGDVFVFGEVMSTAGYYFSLAITWVLCSYLISQKRIGNEVFVWSGACLFFGQLSGDGLSRVFVLLQTNSAVVCVLGVFLLLFSGLVFATNDRVRGEWGGVSPAVDEQPGMYRQACTMVAEASGLTARESELLYLFARGRSVEFVHKTLFISKDTVKTHARSIYRKTGIHSQQELIDLVEHEIELLKSNEGS